MSEAATSARPCTKASRFSVTSGKVNTAERFASSSSTGAGAFPVRFVSAYVKLRPASVRPSRYPTSANACVTSDGEAVRHPVSEKCVAPV